MKKCFCLPICFLFGLIFIGFNTASLANTTKNTHAVVTFVVYKDDQCKTALGDFKVDTSKACVPYTYTDSKGKKITGSMGDFRCYKDNLVVNKYPFTGDCVASHSV